MKVSMILAAATNGVIGNNNTIPWHLKSDMKYFREKTAEHCVIMGRKTWKSILSSFGKPLPNRTNIVITRKPDVVIYGVIVAHSLEEALDISRIQGEAEAMIIGGAQIYRQALELDLVDTVYLTRVFATPAGDAIFSWDFDETRWLISSIKSHSSDEKNEYPYEFRVIDRIRDKPKEV